MPFKNPEDKRAYQREWCKTKRASPRGDSMRNSVNRARSRKRAFVQRVKTLVFGSRCSNCGGVHHHEILDFHHVGGDKVDTVSRLASSNHRLSTIKNEIRKCVLLCSNCHRYAHLQIRTEED